MFVGTGRVFSYPKRRLSDNGSFQDLFEKPFVDGIYLITGLKKNIGRIHVHYQEGAQTTETGPVSV
jgi:hypothetical protein